MAGAGRALRTLVPPSLRLQPSQVTSAGLWGCTLTVGALWLIQPFDWIRAQLSKEEEKSS